MRRVPDSWLMRPRYALACVAGLSFEQLRQLLVARSNVAHRLFCAAPQQPHTRGGLGDPPRAGAPRFPLQNCLPHERPAPLRSPPLAQPQIVALRGQVGIRWNHLDSVSYRPPALMTAMTA